MKRNLFFLCLAFLGLIVVSYGNHTFEPEEKLVEKSEGISYSFMTAEEFLQQNSSNEIMKLLHEINPTAVAVVGAPVSGIVVWFLQGGWVGQGEILGGVVPFEPADAALVFAPVSGQFIPLMVGEVTAGSAIGAIIY